MNNNNITREDWETVKPRIDTTLEKLKSDLAELRKSDKVLLKKFIKMRSEIKELSKEAAIFQEESFLLSANMDK